MSASPGRTSRRFPAIYQSTDAIVDFVFVGDVLDRWQADEPHRDSRTSTPSAVISFWQKATPSSEVCSVPSSNAFSFEYTGASLDTLHEFTSCVSIFELAEELALFLDEKDARCSPSMKTVLVGHGYGGLICEQVIVLLSTLPALQRAKEGLQGLILFGTPHSLAGLAQWTHMSIKRMGIDYDSVGREHHYLKCAQGFEGISEMQKSFRQLLKDDAVRPRVFCLYADHPEPKSNLVLAKEWSVLPRARPIGLRCCYSNITMESTFIRPAVESGSKTWFKVWDLMEAVVRQSREGEYPSWDPFPLMQKEAFLETSSRNDPAVRFDPTATKYYFMCNAASDRAEKIRLGDIVESPRSLGLIATSQLVEPYLPSHLREKGLDPTFVVRNDLLDWENAVDRIEVPHACPYLLRCEWSRERSAEYLKAALDNSGIKTQLLDDNKAVFLVTGILHGSYSSDPLDMKYSPTERAVGYRFLEAVINTDTGLVAWPEVASRGKSRSSKNGQAVQAQPLSFSYSFLKLDEVNKSDFEDDNLKQQSAEDGCTPTIPATEDASESITPYRKIRSPAVTQLTDKTNSDLTPGIEQKKTRPSKMQRFNNRVKETAHFIGHTVKLPFNRTRTSVKR